MLLHGGRPVRGWRFGGMSRPSAGAPDDGPRRGQALDMPRQRSRRGAIAQWLCRQAGAGGHVLATDIDTRFLEALTEPNLELRRHNVITDPLPADTFDLVHTRMVLMHIPEREQLVGRLNPALKP